MQAPSRLGSCEVCGTNAAIYSCPKCEVKTCTVKCINIHKKELSCDGIRDRVKYVSLQKFSNLDLLNDYRLLEDYKRYMMGIKRSKVNPFTKGRRLQQHTYALKSALYTKYQITLKILPKNFKKRKQNRTYFNLKKQEVYWQVEFIFVNARNFKVQQSKCCGTEKLCKILFKYFHHEKQSIYNEPLKYYQSAGLNNVNIYVKADNKPGKKYYKINVSSTLNEIFYRKTIIEFPSFYIVLKDHEDIFEVIDSDSDDECTSSDAFAVISRLIKSEEIKEKCSTKNSLLFTTECEGSSDDE